MDNRRDKYQRIEFLTGDEGEVEAEHPERGNDRKRDGDKFVECRRIDVNDNDDDNQEPELFPPSPMSSSPPKDFDINFESQYMPIFDENIEDTIQRSSSLASSLSIESHPDYANSPVHLTTTKSARVVRCPVCEKPMRTFYCAKCIQRGHFVTPMQDDCTTEANMFPKLPDIELPFDEKVSFADEHKVLEETLQIRLRTLTKKTEALKGLLKDQKSKLEQTKNLVKGTEQQLAVEKKSNKSMEGKIELIKRFITSRTSSVKKRRDETAVLIDDLKQHVNRRVYQITNDVFPIEEINLLEQSNSFVNMETSPLLTFSDGSHHQIEQQTGYSIVEPWLPSNGDYSAYSLWVNDNQDHASISDISERNPAFRIGAGLSYTNQLVNNLASYLDVILPARMDPDTFNRKLLNDPQFSYNVAKLNANVIHLCVSQGVDLSLLNPQRTLKNLMLLFNVNISDLGRKPIVELDNEEVAGRIEDQLAGDLSLVQDDFYDFSKFVDDDDDVFDSEWEISDTINPMEMQLATEQSIQQNSYTQQISRLPFRLFASFWSTGN